MDPVRAARRIIADNEEALDNIEMAENLRMNVRDLYTYTNGEHPQLILEHNWGDPLVTIAILAVNDEEEPIGYTQIELQGSVLYELATELSTLLPKRDFGVIVES